MIKDLQQASTEVGRIRTGALVPTRSGKMRPSAIDTFRLTSPRADLIEQAAKLFGGTVEEWTPPRGNAQWQVITETSTLPILVPPQNPAEGQWYELWNRGGCARRCDGERERIGNTACLCDPTERACSIHTRIRVVLEDLETIGTWGVNTGSWYAARELPGIAALLANAGGLIPGKLVLSERVITRAGETKRFAVPTLDISGFTPRELLSGKVPELAAERRAAEISAAREQRPALASRVNYAALALAARNRAVLRELAEEAKAAGAFDDALAVVLRERWEELPADGSDRDEVLIGEIVEGTP